MNVFYNEKCSQWDVKGAVWKPVIDTDHLQGLGRCAEEGFGFLGVWAQEKGFLAQTEGVMAEPWRLGRKEPEEAGRNHFFCLKEDIDTEWDVIGWGGHAQFNVKAQGEGEAQEVSQLLNFSVDFSAQ